MYSIRHFLTIKAPQTMVYKALTTQEGLSQWWTRETCAAPVVGSIAVLQFANGYTKRLKVTVLEPEHRVEWFCENAHEEWVGTRFWFDLSDHDGETFVQFAQEGWCEQTDWYARCNHDWGKYMQSLKQYCETGKGVPFQEQSV